MNKARAPRYRRRRYVIDKKFQLKFGFWLMVDVFVASLLMGMVLLSVQRGVLRSALLEGHAPRWTEMTPMLILFGLGFAVLSAGAFSIWSVMVTHRLCGPIHLVCNWLGELAKGRFPRKRPLREKDEAVALYDEFWTAVDCLKAAKQVEYDALTDVFRMVRSVERANEADRRAALQKAAARIASLRDAAAESLGLDRDDTAATPDAQRAPGEQASGEPILQDRIAVSEKY